MCKDCYVELITKSLDDLEEFPPKCDECDNCMKPTDISDVLDIESYDKFNFRYTQKIVSGEQQIYCIHCGVPHSLDEDVKIDELTNCYCREVCFF